MDSSLIVLLGLLWIVVGIVGIAMSSCEFLMFNNFEREHGDTLTCLLMLALIVCGPLQILIYTMAHVMNVGLTKD